MRNGGGTAAVRESYTTRRARFTAAADELARGSSRVSHLRALTFGLVVAAGVLLERRPGFAAGVLVVVLVAAFVALVAMHRRLRRREAWQRELAALNEAGLLRLDRSWHLLPARAAAITTTAHAYAEDLDLFGRASLAQLLGPGASILGTVTLDGWLLEHAAPAVVQQRQEAARELGPRVELREELAVHGRRSRSVRSTDVDRFLQWSEEEPWFAEHTLLPAAAWLLPAAAAVLLALNLAGLTGPLWLIPVIAAGVLSLRFSPRIHRTFDAAFGREGMFEQFPELIGIVADARFDGPLLRELRERTRPDGESARTHIARLRSIMHHADMRMSSIHVVVQVATLWDFHVMAALERWQRRHGRAVRDWLRATAEVEALAALATLAHDHPDWTFPSFVAGEPRVVADDLGHPLIGEADRVPNDVEVGPPGTFLLVTGSNMSGKSTLLRAIGVNVVLAQAGGPCCARRLALTPLRVRTSIHVQDSLARGVSHFMAELERLKQVVDAADVARAEDGTVLFLLDEILHGTNTAERRIAARRVIRHLTNVGAIGAVTTHDLELVDDPDLADRARLVHFQETFDAADDRALSFDYTLRDGLATSTNALKLMHYVGLPDE